MTLRHPCCGHEIVRANKIRRNELTFHVAPIKYLLFNSLQK